MAALACWLVKKPVSWAIVLLCLGLTGLCGRYALAVDQDDDLLAFLPADNQAVADFRSTNEEFGGLDVAIVGIEAADPFAGPFLEKLDKLTRQLGDETSINLALSLSNVEDFAVDEKKGGIEASYLARPAPKTPEASKALREKVMSRDHIVGNLIAPDAKSVIVYAFLAPDAEPRATAELIQEKVRAVYPDETVYWGGAPFISTYIYDTTQADMRKLIPWAVVVIILIIVGSFRDVVGALLALVSTGMGIVVTYGLMGMRGVDANIVLGSMPVILFAVGSAYAIHVLVRYYALRGEMGVEEALVETLTGIGPVVAAAGLTTVAGLMSFLAMDIQPMRSFGLYTGLGILATLVLALTFVPAVIRVVGLKARTFERSRARDMLVALATGAKSRRMGVTGVLLVVGIGGAALAGRVEARMETAAFFNEGSPPDRAETFLRDSFGGSQFIQVMVEGDMNDPGVLREVQAVGDRIAVLPHVSSVATLPQVLSLLNEAFTGARRLPETTAQVRVLYRFLQGRPVLDQFMTKSRKRSLMQVKIDTDEHDAVVALLSEIEALVKTGAVRSYRILGRKPAAEESGADAKPIPLKKDEEPLVRHRQRDLTAARVLALLVPHDWAKGIGGEAVAGALEGLDAKADGAAVKARLSKYLTSAESILEDEDYGVAPAIASNIVALGPKPSPGKVEGAVAQELMKPLPEDCEEPDEDAEDEDDEDDGDAAESDEEDPCAEAIAERKARRDEALDLAFALMTPIDAAWRKVRSEAMVGTLFAKLKVTPAEAPATERLRARLGDALLDLALPHALVPSDNQAQGELRYLVTGTPVLYRGLSESVTNNQLRSLGLALGLVLVIMVLLFRSLWSGLLAAAPTVLTLLVIYGAMGAMGLHLDIGTSMLASIIIGAGVDYAVHLLAAWKAEGDREPAEAAAEHAGPAIWTNAIMVAAGFFVLTLGEAKPLENVGGLTSAAMICAAVATFVALPALARKLSYRR